VEQISGRFASGFALHFRARLIRHQGATIGSFDQNRRFNIDLVGGPNIYRIRIAPAKP
jgi:hypothetical protein